MEKSQDLLIRNVRDRLDSLGWSVSDLARAAKISVSGIHGIVRGERFTNPDNLDRIAAALGLTVAELFSGEKPAPAVAVAPSDAIGIAIRTLQAIPRDFLDAIPTLTKTQWKMIRVVIEDSSVEQEFAKAESLISKSSTKAKKA